jgi:hypothetical protein
LLPILILDSWCGARAWASPEEAYIKEITVSEMFRQMGFAFQGTFPPVLQETFGAASRMKRANPINAVPAPISE